MGGFGDRRVGAESWREGSQLDEAHKNRARGLEVGTALCRVQSGSRGQTSVAPKVWPPKNARATIHTDPTEKEVFVMLKSVDGDDAQDVQIKLHPDMIVLHRDCPDA